MMLSPFRIVAVFAAALGAGALVAAPQPPKGFDGNFALVKTRNIFDPQRQPGLAGPAPTAAPVTRSDFAALTGILVTSDKTLAFFSGSRPEFNTVLKPGASIAGATIARITPTFIEVTRDGKTIPVMVGQTVPLDAASAPGAAPAPAPIATPATASTPSIPSNLPVTTTSAPASAPAASPSSVPNVDREAVMRRMMQKRQQELR